MFRKRKQLSIVASVVGTAAITAILLTTWWVEGMRITLISGLSWLAALSIAYWFAERRRSATLS